MEDDFKDARKRAFKRADAMIEEAKELTKLCELHRFSHPKSLIMRSNTLREHLSNHRDLVEKIKLQHPFQDKLAPFTKRMEEMHEKVAKALELLPKKRNDRPGRRKAPVDIKREVKHGEGGSKTTMEEGSEKATQLASELFPGRFEDDRKVKVYVKVGVIST
ncbi:hypothetical protein C5167_016264 [Papaver somniferum]|uniref:uncharacterized protein LOC113332757 n=1 Tax=Papaver somniferum TaxID=3469 RepID=UPI000E6F6802|nr:uncharacterized protein LOC113332757 [Papaver somniferum]XP_026435059.1 uncharacterized protein LOC113332757 [Papaver somniferum]XP_026435060.1 uncharacterized protein LOC113332757 [Papaver somniferum]RZC88462.1 hypothetical protein C5167_016264 [Papaver somniferum]